MVAWIRPNIVDANNPVKTYEFGSSSGAVTVASDWFMLKFMDQDETDKCKAAFKLKEIE